MLGVDPQEVGDTLLVDAIDGIAQRTAEDEAEGSRLIAVVLRYLPEHWANTMRATTVNTPKSSMRCSKSWNMPIAAPLFCAWTMEKKPSMTLISSVRYRRCSRPRSW